MTEIELEPKVLKNKIDNGEDIIILDVRTEAEFNSWKISYDRYNNPTLFPVDRLFYSNPDDIRKNIPNDKEIITVCAHGQRSLMAAQVLKKLGYNVKSVRNGMSGWNKVYDMAEISLENNHIHILQIRRISKGCIGYVVYSDESKNAVLIDIPCQVYQPFNDIIKEKRLEILAVIDTHIHADHLSAGPTIAKNFDCYLISGESYQELNESIKNRKISNNEEISLDKGTKIKAIRTPGHTPGSMSFLLHLNEKQILFTGDTLFLDSLGRPDLHDRSREYASDLFDTFHNVINSHVDSTIILPSHYNINSIVVKHGVPLCDTLRKIKEGLTILSLERESFVDYMSEHTPLQPPNYKFILSQNKIQALCESMDTGELESGPNSCSIM